MASRLNRIGMHTSFFQAIRQSLAGFNVCQYVQTFSPDRRSQLRNETAFTEPLSDDVMNFQAQASSCGPINKEPTGKFCPSSNYWPSDWICTSAERASASQRTGLCPWVQKRGGCQSDFKWARSLCEKWWQDEQSVCRRGENSNFTETISRYLLATDVHGGLGSDFKRPSARLATDALRAIPFFSMQTVAFIKIVTALTGTQVIVTVWIGTSVGNHQVQGVNTSPTSFVGYAILVWFCNAW